jgi:hypothetical protein
LATAHASASSDAFATRVDLVGSSIVVPLPAVVLAPPGSAARRGRHGRSAGARGVALSTARRRASIAAHASEKASASLPRAPWQEGDVYHRGPNDDGP